ncbi:hypothetical protein [Paludisphaera soli]|uniref:hypothetical protein n=1 Tax=Paludisphaera soli TaxID=2712865 RepID=UPI0013EC54DE|nr:hypothetical protein [Paludisphaera soli]
MGERSWQPSIWGRTRDGELIVPEKRLETELDILSGEGNCVFVTPRARAALERAGFREVTYRPTCFVPYVVGLDIYGYPEEAVPNMDVIAETGRKADEPIRYWEIDSPLTLPPVSPSMDLADRSGTPLEPECGRSIVRREGFFVPVELRYRAADLSAFGPFDLARTCEAFTRDTRFDRTKCSLIASRRFYEACVSAGLRAEWSPVRIDP